MSTMDDLISRQAAILALWKALFAYEDKTEKLFQECDELDVDDWIMHREFVQNMSDIDRLTILNLPSADVVPVVRCKDCRWCEDKDENGWCLCTNTGAGMPLDGFCSDGERKDE